MSDSVSQFIWYTGFLLECAFVVCSLVRKSFLRYIFLNFYVLSSIAASLGRSLVLHHYGIDSDRYMYVYYYTDALLTLALFLALISLYAKVFADLSFGKYVRYFAVVLLVGTTLFSFLVVWQSDQQLSTYFAYELSQNLYFVGLVLTYILWGSLLKLRESRTRLVQFVLSFGLYFSAYAAAYALVNMANKSGVITYVSPLLGCLLPLSWFVTMLRTTEDERLATAKLVAVPR